MCRRVRNHKDRRSPSLHTYTLCWETMTTDDDSDNDDDDKRHNLEEQDGLDGELCDATWVKGETKQTHFGDSPCVCRQMYIPVKRERERRGAVGESNVHWGGRGGMMRELAVSWAGLGAGCWEGDHPSCPPTHDHPTKHGLEIPVNRWLELNHPGERTLRWCPSAIIFSLIFSAIRCETMRSERLERKKESKEWTAFPRRRY